MKTPAASIQEEIKGCTGKVGWGYRYIISLLCFLALMMSYIMRFCLSIAIVEMVRSHHKGTNNSFVDPDRCPLLLGEEETTLHVTKKVVGEFDWSEETQGLVLSSFFWGYVLTQLPGGQMSERYGGKAVLGIGLLISSLGTLVTPWATRLGSYPALIAVRIFIGLGQGLVYPSIHCITAQWITLEERGRLGCFVFAGVNFGNMVSMSLSGLILGLYEGGWPILFYMYGAIGLLWCFTWFFLGYSSPNDHPSLSDSEAAYLKQYLTDVNANRLSNKTPWGKILRSWPMWALVIGQIGHDWGLFTIVTDLPKYMKSVMHYSVAQNGALLGLPYLLMWIIAVTSGWFTDWLLKKNCISVTTTRKIFTTLASVGPSLGILGATYSGCDRGMATGFFVLGISLMGFFYPSLKVNALDLSPNYAGTISAFVIGIGAVSGIITPYLVGLLTPHSTLLEWRLVFWIAVVVLIVTNIIYVLFGSGEIQEWNNCNDTTGKKSDKPAETSDKKEEEFSSIPL